MIGFLTAVSSLLQWLTAELEKLQSGMLNLLSKLIAWVSRIINSQTRH